MSHEPNDPGQGTLDLSSRRIVDWLVAAFIVIVGLLTTVAGFAVYQAADRSWIQRLVEEGTIEGTGLTEAELVETVLALMTWGGLGATVIGLALVIVGVAFAIHRTRVLRRAEATGVEPANTVADALVGAVVTVLTSFVPFSAVIGGGVAGYLQGGGRRRGATVGALSGVFLGIPTAAFLLVVMVALFQAGLGWVGSIVLFSLLFALAYSVGLGALGGYVGAYLQGRDDGPA